MADHDEDLILHEIIISRLIDKDGNRAFRVRHTQDFNFVDALGLLEAAKWELFDMQSRNIRRCD
jgi:hypothetical protein